MRLSKYITEDAYDDVRVLKHIVSRECKPFLKEFGVEYKHDRCIWRGAKQYSKNITRIKTRQDRQPRYNHFLHSYLSKISKKIFGWDIRTKGVFTGSVNVSKGYGKRYIFIPIGKYRYVWTDLDSSDIYTMYDRYELFSREKTYIGFEEDEMSPEEYKKYKKDQETSINNDLEDLENDIYNEYKDMYETSGLNLRSTKPFEAVFDCKEYLLINGDSYHIFKMAMMEL